MKKTHWNHKRETNTIKKLSQREDVIIRPANKGGGLVLLSKEKYLGELDRQLEDFNTYKPLSGDPT